MVGFNDVLASSFGCDLQYVGEVTISETGVAQVLYDTNIICAYVWVTAPMNTDSTSVNFETVYIGDATTQVMPLLKENDVGILLPVKSSKDIYIKGASGDKVCLMVLGA